MSYSLLNRCFTSFIDYIESRNATSLNKLTKRFMKDVKNEFTDGSVEITKGIKDKKYSFNGLVSFLDFCENGEWSDARVKFEQAYAEYQTFVHTLDTLKTNAEDLRQHDHIRDTTNGTIQTDDKKTTGSNKSQDPRGRMESSFGNHSAAQTPGDKYQTTLKHTTVKTIQGQSVQTTARQIDQYDSRNYTDVQQIQSEHHKEHDPNEVDIYRRSKSASILLRDNNPIIADLSDSNRPTKLAERFSELYSNEHTDTFEELAKCYQEGQIADYHETEIVKDLLTVVKYAYDHCTKWNENIENMLETDKQTTTPKSEDELIQLKGKLLERKKKLVKDKADDIVETFMGKTVPNISPRHVSEKAKTNYMKYAKATVEIVWWMCAQNPPIHLEYAESGPFHSDFYRSYTKTGQFVDFCVWPLVRLHKNGPILSKGIAQGTNVQSFPKFFHH